MNEMSHTPSGAWTELALPICTCWGLRAFRSSWLHTAADFAAATTLSELPKIRIECLSISGTNSALGRPTRRKYICRRAASGKTAPGRRNMFLMDGRRLSVSPSRTRGADYARAKCWPMYDWLLPTLCCSKPERCMPA